MKLRFEGFRYEIQVIDHAVGYTFVGDVIHGAVHPLRLQRLFCSPRIRRLIQSSFAKGDGNAVHLIDRIVTPQNAVRLQGTSWSALFGFRLTVFPRLRWSKYAFLLDHRVNVFFKINICVFEVVISFH